MKLNPSNCFTTPAHIRLIRHELRIPSPRKVTLPCPTRRVGDVLAAIPRAPVVAVAVDHGDFDPGGKSVFEVREAALADRVGRAVAREERVEAKLSVHDRRDLCEVDGHAEGRLDVWLVEVDLGGNVVGAWVRIRDGDVEVGALVAVVVSVDYCICRRG